ncbi:MAG: permease, partial [Rubrobacteraceae bacterium]
MSGLLEASRWFVIVTAQMVALFLVLSFVIGLLQAWVPEEKLRSMFKKRGPVGAYLGGAALGAITPFCSFSTIPVLIGLLRSGAPFGPTMTFLFASPLLDPVILGVLAFVIGVEGAVLYTIVTFAAAIGMGILLAKLGFESDIREKTLAEESAENGCSMDLPMWRKAWRGAWRFFVPVLPYLLVGTAIGAVVYGFVPTAWISSVAGPEQPLAIPAAAALGVPIYVNAETFFPITNALMDRG